jgi:hypothetical protein
MGNEIIKEMYADNGQLSHYDIINKKTGETMKSLTIEIMNAEKQMYEQIKSLFTPYMVEDLADLKTNEVMRVTGHSFVNTGADDACPYCNQLSNENGNCLCIGS